MSGVDDLMMEITPQVLLKAYACSIFPMAETAADPGLFWVEPEMRGIIPLDAFHVPRRLARTVRQQPYRLSVDTAFGEVLRLCAEDTPDRPQTWINGRIAQLYNDLHAMGHCHSVECWSGDDLVGGLYGVRLGGAFFGESMFSRARDASKIALVHLVDRMKMGGFQLLDTQFNTAHLSQFGAIEISKRDYEQLLIEALTFEADFYAFDKAANS
ncbi:MAG: leucyl/phenylalanyl-tRNA--protein transferase [Rhizobiaceae bacterium]|nr:leucyl/phenylalanyl-tRNA--protein transferase [Rhizobiaceae bacterium]